jgi:hypothetical protein
MAAPLACHQKALVDQLLEGQHNRAARDAELEAAICRSRMAATMAWRICACSVWPDSAEMRKSPDQIAVSFLCGIVGSSSDGIHWNLDHRMVALVQSVAPIKISDC